MSGRVRVTLDDGRRVTGYRKTLRVQSKRRERTPPHLLPNYTLTFILPPTMSLLFGPGHVPGLIGVVIGDLGEVRVCGKNRDWVISQAGELFRSRRMEGRAPIRINAVLTRDDEPGPTVSGPIRKGASAPCEIMFSGHGATIVQLHSMRHI